MNLNKIFDIEIRDIKFNKKTNTLYFATKHCDLMTFFCRRFGGVYQNKPGYYEWRLTGEKAISFKNKYLV